MKKQLIFTLSCLFIWSTWAIAESNLVDIPAGELLDAYIEDPSTKTRTPLQDSGEATIDSNEELANERAVELREVANSDNVEIDEANPAPSARPEVVSNEANGQSSDNLEVIELESYEDEIVEVQAPGSDEVQVATPTKAEHPYCQQNPLANECLYSPYLSRCKKDPQSAKCTTQLEKFENFCNTFPRAYKCKKAQLAATCKKQPELNECKRFSERYCQKYPKAIFCKWN